MVIAIAGFIGYDKYRAVRWKNYVPPSLHGTKNCVQKKLNPFFLFSVAFRWLILSHFDLLPLYCPRIEIRFTDQISLDVQCTFPSERNQVKSRGPISKFQNENICYIASSLTAIGLLPFILVKTDRNPLQICIV